MRILYLHQFFITRSGAGGTRSYEFARRFVSRGHRVRMVTAGGGRASVDGIEVEGVRGAYSDYMSATSKGYLERLLAFARFALAAAAAALRGPRPDVIYATSPPLTMALPAIAASVRHRAPLVFEVRDLWPEAPIQMGALTHPLAQRAARRLESFVYARSAAVIALSPGIRDGVLAAGVPSARVTLVPNAADLDVFSPDIDGSAMRARLGLGERFTCAYFGTLGEANDLGIALEAARLAPELAFVVMGAGKRRAALEAGAPPNVIFAGPASSKHEVAELAAAAGACLTAFKQLPILSTNSPNKLFDTFAAGRPAIVNMDGWMRELVELNDAGVNVRDAAELAAALRRLRDDPAEAARMGRNARALAEREFARDLLADRALGVLEAAAR